MIPSAPQTPAARTCFPPSCATANGLDGGHDPHSNQQKCRRQRRTRTCSYRALFPAEEVIATNGRTSNASVKIFIFARISLRGFKNARFYHLSPRPRCSPHMATVSYPRKCPRSGHFSQREIRRQSPGFAYSEKFVSLRRPERKVALGVAG